MTITTNLLKRKNLYLLPIFGFEVGMYRATCESENSICLLSEFFINLANLKITHMKCHFMRKEVGKNRHSKEKAKKKKKKSVQMTNTAEML